MRKLQLFFRIPNYTLGDVMYYLDEQIGFPPSLFNSKAAVYVTISVHSKMFKVDLNEYKDVHML